MIKNITDEIIKYGQILGMKNMSPGISGNISVRAGENILITVSGSANGFLDESDFALIDMNGSQLSGEKNGSSEKLLHLEFYRQREDINAIIHVHSPYLTSFSATGIGMYDAILPEIVYCFSNIPIADYAIPGTKELVEKTAKYFKDYDIILMKNHGVIVGADNIKNAYLKLELCEAYAQTLICAKILGGAKILTKEQTDEIYSLRTRK